MKQKHFLFLVIATLAMLSCEEDANIETFSKQISVAAEASQCIVNFKCNVAWEATVDAAWCSLEPTRGDGMSSNKNLYITAKVEANPVAEQRTAYVTIKAGSASKTIPIVQVASAAEISLSPSLVRCVQAEREYSIHVISNGYWTATVNDAANNSWCTITPAEGSGNGTVTVSVTKNHAYPRRHALITFANNEKQLTDTIMQDGELYSDPSLGVTINGITWATRNVNTFGSFTEWPTDAGKYYQFNKTVAYSPTNPVSPAWDSNPVNELKDWEIINDPCPTGWRIPSSTEYESLLRSGYRFVKENDELAGLSCGPDASLNNGEQVVFFPVAGGIYAGDWKNLAHFYWSCTTLRKLFDTKEAYTFEFGSDSDRSHIYVFYRTKKAALPVRCVKE